MTSRRPAAKRARQQRAPWLIVPLAGISIAFVTLPFVALLQRAPWSNLGDLVRQPVVTQALRLSVTTALAATGIAGLLSVLINLLSAEVRTDPIYIGLTAVISGLIFGLIFGLDAVVQNALFRVLLSIYGIAPLRYVRWLDHVVLLRFLYRGPNGGYLFIHRMVQEFFCTEDGLEGAAPEKR